jgi:hypothetical protein
MRVAVVLHERLGEWYRQLRPRLSERRVRWLESRSLVDLERILEGLAFPVVLVDLARQPRDGLAAVDIVRRRAPGALTLVLDPEAKPDVPGLVRELGATHVGSGFVPPPCVADLLARWIALASIRIESAGWSRSTLPETTMEPWAWLSDYLGDPAAAATPARSARTSPAR